ncbi:MAG: hypothetical protein ACFFHD_07840 [Promethearchaeota archaeon]
MNILKGKSIIGMKSLILTYIADLSLGIDVERTTFKFLKSNSAKISVCVKSPKGLWAGAVYFASRIKNVLISQKVIAKKVRVTVVTLRSRYKELKAQI